MAFLGALSPRAPPGVEQMADADRGQFAADTLGEKSAAPAADDPAGAAPAGAAQPQDEPAATTGSSTDQPAEAAAAAAANPHDTSPDAVSAQPADSTATWEEWGQGSLASAAVMEEVASEHLQAASEWAAYGDPEAAREELAEAQVAADLGAESATLSQAQFEMAAEYREHAGDGPAPGDATEHEPGQYDASASDASSYDYATGASGAADSGSPEPEPEHESPF